MLRPGRVLTGDLAPGSALWTTRHRDRTGGVWALPVLPGRRWGRLYARSGGDGPSGVLLLHGLVATGDVFGAGPICWGSGARSMRAGTRSVSTTTSAPSTSSPTGRGCSKRTD